MSDEANLPVPAGQFLIYADGATRLQVRLEGNTIWLTQKLIAELYEVSVKTVNEHLVNIYNEAELPPEATIRNFRIVQREGTRDVARNAMLDDFLKLSERNILTHADQVSHETARLKAEAEFETFRVAQAALPQPVDQHFADAIDELKTIEKQTAKPKRKRKGADDAK